MKAMTIVIKLSQSQLARAAMLAEGMNPARRAMKRGTRVEANRKRLQKQGYAKHKGRSLD